MTINEYKVNHPYEEYDEEEYTNPVAEAREDLEYEIAKNGTLTVAEAVDIIKEVTNIAQTFVVDEEDRDFRLNDINYNDYVVIGVLDIDELGSVLKVREVL